MLLLRRMKRSYFTNKQFRNYFWYALGEMFLVIIGILIALQIDNWNTERVQEVTLNSYLKTIAGNIGNDLRAVSAIRTARENAYELSLRTTNFASRKEFLSAAEVIFASRAIEQALRPLTFNANTSGYEALTSSGNLDQMQGSDIETLLYDYYDTVVRIFHYERNHNEYNRLLWLQALAKWPESLVRWEFTAPVGLTTDRLQALQPAYRQLLQEINTLELLGSPQSVGPLILDYERLELLGTAFRRTVETGIMEFDDTTIRILDSIYDPGSGNGYPKVIVDGQVSWQSYYVINSDSDDPRVSYQTSDGGRQGPFTIETFQRIGDSLHIDYSGGVEWAGIWFNAGTSLASGWSADYSMFDKLVLEMKGDVGGEKIHLNIEDLDDPMDGTSTKVTLQLTDQWETYEIDLAEFVTAELEILRTPFGFVFYQDAVSFSVRTAKYVASD